MSNLRDKFVGNADENSVHWYPVSTNSSRDPLSYPEPNYDRTQTRPYYPASDRAGSSSNTNFQPSNSGFIPQSSHTNTRYDTRGSAESYELYDVQKNPFEQRSSSNQHLDPFSNPRNDSYYGYNVSPEQNIPQANYMESPRDENYLLDKQIRQNERNRRKLANRLPRFHYTKLPWFSMIVTLAQVIVFIVELAKMGIWTGSPFQTKPYFNPMLGPSTYVLINMGARYVPCMHRISGITSDTSIQFPCPNSTSIDTNVCSLSELCGLGGIPIVDNEYVPSQYYRIVLPIFLHAGFLHILFNMFLQLSMGLAVERSIGWLKYSIIYISSGVSGFLLGANFSPNGVASTGASGSLFGVIAANFLLFIYCGTKNTNIYETKRYKTFILIMVAEVVVSFVLGLLPGLDNFSHIGGFCMGVLTSIVLLPDPSFVYINGIYTYEPDTPTWKLFVNNWNPFSNYENKVPWKIAVWVFARLASLALAIVYFALLTKNLKSKKMESNTDTCTWCKYLNCIPVNGWCEQGEVTVSTSDSDTGTTTTNASPTTTTASATNAEIFNAPTGTSNAKRFLDTAPNEIHTPIARIGLSAEYLNVRPDSGSLALLVVVGLFGYKAVQKLRSKIAEKREKRKSRKERTTL